MIPLPIPTIAQLDKLPDGYLLWWLVAFGGLALIVQTVLNVADRLKAKKAAGVIVSPDPLRTQSVPELATRAELEAMSERIEADLDEVKAQAASRELAREAQVIALHNRINNVAEGLEAIRGQLAEIAQNQRLLMNKFLK